MLFTDTQKQTIYNVIQSYSYRKAKQQYSDTYDNYVDDMYDVWFYFLHNKAWCELTFAEQYDLATAMIREEN